jgi:hypothetical protein
MKRTLGGTKWWQVRDTQGYVCRFFPMSQLTHVYDRSVEAEWVTAEKARESPRPYQRKHRRKGATDKRPSLRVVLSDGSSGEDDSENAHSDRRPEMDDAPCLLYIHGGNALFQHVKQAYISDGRAN